jgi:hypothetical protein
VVKERIYLDKGNPNTLHDEITTIDPRLDRPWTVHRVSIRSGIWMETICGRTSTR